MDQNRSHKKKKKGGGGGTNSIKSYRRIAHQIISYHIISTEMKTKGEKGEETSLSAASAVPAGATAIVALFLLKKEGFVLGELLSLLANNLLLEGKADFDGVDLRIQRIETNTISSTDTLRFGETRRSTSSAGSLEMIEAFESGRALSSDVAVASAEESSSARVSGVLG
jgi:hypothetical protein